jgi:type IV pilus assembly protein PilA
MNMNNNKGVTLIELLIVIVVIGIISAFAVPAVGNFLDGAKRQAVYQDAVAVRNAAALFCAQPANTCNDGEELDYDDLSAYLEGFDATEYDTESGDILATFTSATNSWQVTLEHIDVVPSGETGEYEWVTATDPINADSSETYVTLDED